MKDILDPAGELVDRLRERGDRIELTGLAPPRDIRDRFTVEMLEKYLKHLGLDAFNKDWYMPDANSEAVLIKRKWDKHWEGHREYTLHEARVG